MLSPSSILYRDSNPCSLEHESPPITTRGPALEYFYDSMLKFVYDIDSKNQ